MVILIGWLTFGTSCRSDTLSDDDDFAESEADAPMEMGSSSEDDEDTAPELYPLEGKYKDHADKERLLAMTEIEREAVLAERAQQIERAQQDRHLRNLLKSRTAGDKVNGMAALNDRVRKSSRTKSAPKKTEEATKRGKLDELKRVREERSRNAGSGNKGGDDDSGARRHSIISDDEDQGDFADDVYRRRKEERPIELGDVNRCRIGRTGFGKLCDYPGFEETVVGKLVWFSSRGTSLLIVLRLLLQNVNLRQGVWSTSLSCVYNQGIHHRQALQHVGW
jgi:RNA polymerase-associated protein RTF1